MNGYVVVITLYCIALVGISYVVSKFVKGGNDFMVAGRKLDSGALPIIKKEISSLSANSVFIYNPRRKNLAPADDYTD